MNTNSGISFYGSNKNHHKGGFSKWVALNRLTSVIKGQTVQGNQCLYGERWSSSHAYHFHRGTRGTAFSGGEGKVLRSFVGALIIMTLTVGMLTLVPAYYQTLVIGGALLAAAASNHLVGRKRNEG
ncbi:D-allose transporter subunit [Vibrio thalassae]|uniref:D-allose transporter subunit n=1 Tax=Vibrio thalassae TaxID=1243014 RepID=A0A240EQL2_9VIBR|nr:hypothetical protein [Vibrio thalassae]SNX50904.1 D-allose transporter subunit [Vibrio thalassae]